MRFRAPLVAVVALAAASRLVAAGPTWGGAVSGETNNPLNRVGNTLPTNNGTADLTFGTSPFAISSSAPITLSASFSANSVTFTSGAARALCNDNYSSPCDQVRRAGADKEGR